MSTGIYFEYFAFSPEKLRLLFTQKVRKKLQYFLLFAEVTFLGFTLTCNGVTFLYCLQSTQVGYFCQH